MSGDYVTIGELASRLEKDVDLYYDWEDGADPEELEDFAGTVRITKVAETYLVEIFDQHDMEMPEDGGEMNFSAKENVDFMSAILRSGLVEPEVNNAQDIEAFTGLKVQLFTEIMAHSGLAEADSTGEEEETFPEDSE